MSENAFSTKEQLCILVLLSSLVVVIVVAPLDPMQKLFPLTLIFLGGITYLFALRSLRNLEGKNARLEANILERLEGKKYNVYEENSLSWFYVCVIEALKESKPLFYDLMDRNWKALPVRFRTVWAGLTPNWYCSKCGRQTRWNFKPVCDCLVDPLLEEDTRFLETFNVSCADCTEFFHELGEKGGILIE